MAVYKLFPAQDASIYSAYPAMNTGLDPILDVSNYVTESNAVSRVARSLIQFDQDQFAIDKFSFFHNSIKPDTKSAVLLNLFLFSNNFSIKIPLDSR